ncbi:hypothetical protein [Paucihalobacter sp.]|uniref:hypothetical protein n=1 Tax=Paucihalobacter sp. TaxID=2850405 RepID=UPI003D16101B
MGLNTARRITKTRKKANSLEDRIEQLEQDLANTKILLRKTLVALETHLTKDIDGDGKMG